MRLHELRVGRKLTQKDIAKVLKVRDTTVSNWENEKTQIDYANLIAIADYFQVSLDYLLERDYDYLGEVSLHVAHLYQTANVQAQRSAIYVLEQGQPNKVSASSDIVKTISIRLYDLPASAGTGSYLDSDSFDMINVPDTKQSRDADFALRVSGDSMLPLYSSGDIVLVHAQDTVDVGDIGIFIMDGDAFIKRRGENALISLNATYSNIIPTEFSNIKVAGRVIDKTSIIV